MQGAGIEPARLPTPRNYLSGGMSGLVVLPVSTSSTTLASAPASLTGRLNTTTMVPGYDRAYPLHLSRRNTGLLNRYLENYTSTIFFLIFYHIENCMRDICFIYPAISLLIPKCFYFFCLLP